MMRRLSALALVPLLLPAAAAAQTTYQGLPAATAYLEGTFNANGAYPSSRVGAGWAIGSDFNSADWGTGGVDFWSTVVSADPANDPAGFRFRQKTGASSQALLGALWGDGANFAAFDLMGGGASFEIYVDSLGTALISDTGAMSMHADVILGSGTPADTLPQATLHLADAASTLRAYNAFTDTSNGEWGEFSWASNVLNIGTNKNGTGTARALALRTNGTAAITISTSQVLTLNAAGYANCSSLSTVSGVLTCVP